MQSTVNRPTIFVSYSSLDKHLARRVTRRLLQSGAQIIIDEVDLPPGFILTTELQRQIGRSTHLLVIWTESSAGSLWVAREIEFAREIPGFPPTIIPLFFKLPGRDSVVSNMTGVIFPCVYRFEQAFQNALRSVFSAEVTSGEERLQQDLDAVIQEVPAVARILRNPVEELHTTLRATSLIESEEAFRNKNFPTLQNTFEAWGPDGISVRGLPVATDPEYHALDFALWCASHLVLLKRSSLAPLQPLELKSYPRIFAKVFGATQAGYEALLILLSNYPGLSSEALGELIERAAVTQSSIPGVVELFEEVIAICQKHPAKDQFTPYGALTWFIQNNLDRLSPDHKLRFLQLIEGHSPGPFPGPPLDVLGALCRDAELTGDVVERVRMWVENGLFDQVNAQARSDSPALVYGFVAGMLSTGLRTQAQPLIASIRLRIKKLFRSAAQDKLVKALRWISTADRLPIQERHIIEQAYSEGVLSAEFERSPHAELVRGLAGLLFDSVTHDDQTAFDVKLAVQSKLKEAGITQDF